MNNPIGQTFLNQFRVDAFIGAGGMSTVYKAWDLKRSVYLAMKVLHADLAEDPSVFKLFQREARALEKLAHPNIVPFYGIYQDQGITFLLERFVDGPSLKDILRQKHTLPIQEAVAYLKPMCAALGYAHVNGVVHCDVKPGNVMVDRGGTVYMTDFGVARHAESTTTTLATAGTPAYMAPEQIRGEAVSAETDVYALGIVLYEMLTGRRPFLGDERDSQVLGSSTGERVRYAQLNLPPENPRVINPAILDSLAQVILRCLEKAPAERYHSTQDLLGAALAAISVQSENVSNLVPVTTITPEQRAPQIAASPFEGHPPQPVPVASPPIGDVTTSGRKLHLPTWSIPLAIVAVLAIVVLVVLILYDDSPQPVLPTQEVAVVLPATTTPTPEPFATPTQTPTPTNSPDPTRTPTIQRTVTPTLTESPEVANLPVTIIDPKGIPMELVPRGPFEMGSNASSGMSECQTLYIGGQCDPADYMDEEPVHTVTLGDYYIDKYEVTNAWYADCVGEGICAPPFRTISQIRGSYYGLPDFDTYPVIYVSWEDANTYCQWRGARLPTEAEWEKAARGTTGFIYPWGMAFDGQRTNFCDRQCLWNWANEAFDDGFVDTAPVGTHAGGVSPNGVLDMAGNVWEWVADWYDNGYYSRSPSEDPQGPSHGTHKVLRGGAWNVQGGNTRTATRYYDDPGGYFNTVGFRCARSP